MNDQPRLPGANVAPVWDPLEKEFQAVVIEAARTLGYYVGYFRHVNDVRRGWISPAAADGVGWPDFVIVGRGRILYRETKRRKGKLSPDQAAWGERITNAGGDWAVWTPADWPERIMRELGANVTRSERRG